MKRRCGNCIYHNMGRIKDIDAIGGYITQFECRINPPNDNGWPHVSESDWCGKHELDLDYVREHQNVTSDNEPMVLERLTQEGKP